MISYLNQLHIFSWFDFLEIALLTGIIYHFCLWLKRDRSSFLLAYFYLGGFLFIGAALLNLRAILEFYYYCWPTLVILFIIIHQKNLQQSYIAARTITPPSVQVDKTWIRLLMRASFKALQRKKNITFLVEGAHVLEDYLEKPLILHSPIQQSLLDMIIESNIIQENSLILVNQQGTLCACNCQWLAQNVTNTQSTSKTQNQHELVSWTKTTDALVFFAQADNKRVTIIAQGTIVSDLASDKAELIMSQFIRKHQFIHKELSHKQKSDVHYKAQN